MNQSRTIAMETQHPVKTAISVSVGLFVGLKSLGHHLFIPVVDLEAIVALFIAMLKSFLVGGATWAGQTFVAFHIKKVRMWILSKKRKK